MNPQLAVLTLWAQDVSKTAHFYRDVIGLRLLPVPHDHRPHFDLNGVYLVILRGTPRPAENATPARFPVVAFAVENLEDALTQLQAHHVELPWGVEEDNASRWVMFPDPAGNLIEIAQFK